MTRTSYYWAAATAALIFATAGAGHRALSGRIDQAIGAYLPPGRPLASIPLLTGAWQGVDVEVDARILASPSFDDDYVNRIYTNRRSGTSVRLFAGYSGRTRRTLAHRPDVCFEAHGWDEASVEETTLVAEGGEVVPCIVYEFRRPENVGTTMLALSVNITNGRYMKDASEAMRYNSRNPGLLNERRSYVARIQAALVGRGDRAGDLEILKSFMSQAMQSVKNVMPYWLE